MEGKVSLYEVGMHMVLPDGYSVQSGNLPKGEVTVVRTNNIIRIVGFSCFSDLHPWTVQYSCEVYASLLYNTGDTTSKDIEDIINSRICCRQVQTRLYYPRQG